MGSELTSGVQIYNEDNLVLIDGGVIVTRPDLPASLAPDCPGKSYFFFGEVFTSDQIDHLYSTYGIRVTY